MFFQHYRIYLPLIYIVYKLNIYYQTKNYMDDFDLNIDNYDLEDILNLFHLDI